jgi:putative ABC transport system ATP-binding protein
MTTPLVRARHLRKTYGEGALTVPVLHDVSIDILPGEITLLMGPSGSGKTTLISILAGLMHPSAGNVELCASPITELDEPAVSAVRRRHLGFVFQTYNLFPALTALDNVAIVLRMKGLSATRAQEKARETLVRVGLAERLHHYPGEMSGGQKQRVAIARALAGDPSLVIGDEVTAALDTASGMRVIELLREHVRPETGVLLVTHDHRLEPLADRIVAIEDGAIVEERRGAQTTVRTREAS